MQIQDQLNSINQQIKDLAKRAKWLTDHAKALEALPDGYLCGNQLDFDNLKHADILKVIKALGGKWKKSKNGGNDQRIDYQTAVDGMHVRCWAGEPPPSCRMVEIEEVIPAHTIPAVPEKHVPEQRVKKMKMVCQPDLAAKIAFGAEQAKTDEALNANG